MIGGGLPLLLMPRKHWYQNQVATLHTPPPKKLTKLFYHVFLSNNLPKNF